MDQLHIDLILTVIFFVLFLGAMWVFFFPVFDLDRLVIGSNSKETFPTPGTVGLIVVRTLAYLVILFAAISFLIKANGLLSNHFPDTQTTTRFSENFWASLLQSMAGIAAITVSALLLLTQLISEKYSSVIIHLFRKTTTSYTLLKLQIASIAFLAVTIVFTSTSGTTTNSPSLLSAFSLLLATLSVLSLPPFLISIIQQFRPRGLVDWATELAIEQIKTLPKNKTDGRNLNWLRWHTLVLVEALNSLKAIGALSVKYNDDEITRRVVSKYIKILKFYFQTISNDRAFRERWDARMSEQLLYHYESETDMVLSVSIEDARFWLENNILNSVSYMIEEANANKGEVLFITKEFYEQWSALCKQMQSQVDLDVIAVIKMTLIDFYFIYRRLDLSKNEHLAAENQHFFIKALHRILSNYFKKESSAEEKELENTLKVITGFLKSIGLITSNSGSEKLLQNWLLLIEATYEKIVATLSKDSEVLKLVSPSFVRVYIDLFVESLLTRNHKLSKIILQHVAFSTDDRLLDDIFIQTDKRLTNIQQRDMSVENSIDSSLVRSDKYTYNLVKSCLLVMTYRIYMQNEKLCENKISSVHVKESISKFKEFPLIKEKYIPHLKTEIVSFICGKLNVNKDHGSAIEGIVAEILD